LYALLVHHADGRIGALKEATSGIDFFVSLRREFITGHIVCLGGVIG
jgi:hypothetical protein